MSKFINIDGVRVLADSFKNVNLFTFDEFDNYDDVRGYGKGIVKNYEIKNFKEDYDVDLPSHKKNFPFLYELIDGKKIIETRKITIIDNVDGADEYPYTIYRIQGERNLVHLFFCNDCFEVTIHKDDINKFLEFPSNDNIIIGAK